MNGLKSESTNTLVSKLGETVFLTILERRQQKTAALKGPDGVAYSNENPGWLDAALVLAEYFAPASAWANDTSIIALVQTARRDLEKGIAGTDDQDRISSLTELRDILGNFLEKGNLTVEI